MAKTLLSSRYGHSAKEALKESLATALSAPISRVTDLELGTACATKAMAQESPRTPRQMSTARSVTPPAAPPCFTPRTLMQSHRLQKPMLMKALENKSAADVQAILQHSPETVNEPFWDHDCEPPICYAVRLHCPVTIIQILLEHGASAEETDVRGRTPAQILAESQHQPWEMMTPWEVDTVGGPAPMGPFGCSSHKHAAPFDIEKMWPTTTSFGSYPFVDAAPKVTDFEIIGAELENIFNA